MVFCHRNCCSSQDTHFDIWDMASGVYNLFFYEDGTVDSSVSFGLYSNPLLSLLDPETWMVTVMLMCWCVMPPLQVGELSTSKMEPSKVLRNLKFGVT